MPELAGRRAAFVTASGQRRELKPDTVVTFGRHEACDLRVGVGDDWVSRRVGLVRMDATGAVTVELTRSRHVLRVVTPSQSERVLEPRPAGTVQEQLRLVWEHAVLMVPGQGNVTYRCLWSPASRLAVMKSRLMTGFQFGAPLRRSRG